MEHNKELFDHWSTGRLLETPTTRKFSEEEKDRMREAESRRVFSGFRISNDGRSRRYICTCATEEEARKIVDDHNKHSDLLKALQDLVKEVHQYQLNDAIKWGADYDKAKSHADNYPLILAANGTIIKAGGVV
jgi:hypothetical protein